MPLKIKLLMIQSLMIGSEKFEKSVINLYNKYELFLKNYAENKQFSLEIQSQIKQLKSLLDKHEIS